MSETQMSHGEEAELYGDNGPSPEEVWITRDHQVVLISEMKDSHLLNTIRFLRRNAWKYKLVELKHMGHYIEKAPDGAALACEMEAMAVMDSDDDSWLSEHILSFETMILEAMRRNLEP